MKVHTLNPDNAYTHIDEAMRSLVRAAHMLIDKGDFHTARRAISGLVAIDPLRGREVNVNTSLTHDSYGKVMD